MRFCIHRGSHEIGGNCVEVTTEKTRIILDLGLPLDPPTAEPQQRKWKSSDSLTKLQAAGVLPKVDGVFGARPTANAILLSHAHADHSGLLAFSNPTIPVYMSKGTSKMLMAGSIFAGMTDVARHRKRDLETGQPARIGDITVTPYAVDHSAFDSLAFLVEADGKRILYSGDLRLHGRKPGMALALIKAARRAPIDCLIMEGTHFSSDRGRGPTEKQLENEALGHIRTSPGVVLAIFSPMHVDRLVTFYKAARKAGRLFVVDPYAAYVMHLVAGQCRIPRPTARAGIRVYYNEYFERSYQRRNLGMIHGMFVTNRIELDEILASPQKYLIIFRPTMIKYDFGGKLPAGSRCLYSYWTGYLVRPEWADLKARLAQAGGDFIECHTSGHIFADDIVKFVKAIGPRMVVPIHTTAPDKIIARVKNAVLVGDGGFVTV